MWSVLPASPSPLQHEGEARCLVTQLLQYYGRAREGRDKKWGHLARFHRQTDDFHVMDLVLEFEADPGYRLEPPIPTVTGD